MSAPDSPVVSAGGGAAGPSSAKKPIKAGEEEEEEEEEEGAEGEDEAVAVVGLLATRKARALLKEPAKRLGRMARTRRPRLIRRSGSEACLHETVSDFLLPSLQAPECPRVESFRPSNTFGPS